MSEDLNKNESPSKNKQENEVITTVVGDFILRWGIWSMVVLLILASAYGAKDFEKRRLEQIASLPYLLKKEILDTSNYCHKDLTAKILQNVEDNKMKKKELENVLNILNENKFNLQDNVFKGKKGLNLKKQIDNIPNDMYYEILLCNKKINYLRNIEVIS